MPGPRAAALVDEFSASVGGGGGGGGAGGSYYEDETIETLREVCVT